MPQNKMIGSWSSETFTESGWMQGGDQHRIHRAAVTGDLEALRAELKKGVNVTCKHAILASAPR